VIEKWECEWEKDVKTDPGLQQFLVDFEIIDPLQPRDAFFGRRTNAVKLHHKIDASKEEQIQYMDVTSLYLWVNKTAEYPVGHADIIVNPTDQDIRNYFGMAKVNVLPPHELYHAILPYRHQGKLTFQLCRSCVEQEMSKPLLEKSHCLEYLEKLQHQVLYFDMDSVVYSHHPGQPDVTPGNYLGEMADELEGDHIVEFASAGPKNYGYITNTEKKCCKVRGFTLNVWGSCQLNYDVMRQNLLDEIQDPQDERRNVDVTDPNFFMHDSHTKDMYISSQMKRYGLVFDKRVVEPVTFKSYPYGYTPSTINDADMANVEF